MTFEQFRASAVECTDLGPVIGDDGLMGVPGRVYEGQLFIRHHADALPGAHWWLQIGRDEWASDDLGTLEARLFVWAWDEEYFS